MVSPLSPPHPAVRYGAASLADVLPSALAALGVDGEADVLGLGPAERVIVLLVDGLGWNLLRSHPTCAPFLCGLPGRPLTAGFPTTTAVSLASLGTGLPPGQHGITGYTTRFGDGADPINWLTYRRAHAGTDLRGDYPPEEVQAHPTALERAERAGIATSVVSSAAFRGTGLTRAVLRGGTFVPAFTSADMVTGAAAAAVPERSLVYCYVGDLDLIGHVHGPGAKAWDVQLYLVDRAVELLAKLSPPGARLLVTADHGMVQVPDDARIDLDGDDGLTADIELIAGEARTRYLHVAPGRLAAVRARWQDRLGDRAAVFTRDEVVERGWFGPTVTPEAAERIGDLVVVATSNAALVRSRAEPRIAVMRGHHGALTDDELLVPLLDHTVPG